METAIDAVDTSKDVQAVNLSIRLETPAFNVNHAAQVHILIQVHVLPVTYLIVLSVVRVLFALDAPRTTGSTMELANLKINVRLNIAKAVPSMFLINAKHVGWVSPSIKMVFVG